MPSKKPFVEGYFGFMNKDGNVVVEPQFDRVTDFINGTAIVEKDGKVGYMKKIK